jgi:hypothetical protein
MGAVLCMNDILCLSPHKPKSLEPFADIQPQIDQMRTLRTGTLKSFTDEAYAGAAANRYLLSWLSGRESSNITQGSENVNHCQS